LAAFFLLFTGFSMSTPFWGSSFAWKKPDSFRSLLLMRSSFVLILLFISALTGAGYRWSRNFFGVDKTKILFLLDIHQGSFIHDKFAPFYTLINATGLILMVLTGVTMTPWYRRWINTQNTASTLNSSPVDKQVGE